MIYLIVCRETQTCKIGYSKEPNKRLKQLKTGNANTLELLHVQEGTIPQEQAIHKIFAQYRITGEWFQYNDDIKLYFNIKELSLPKEEYIVYEYLNQYPKLFSCSGALKNFMSEKLNIKAKNISLHIDSLISKGILIVHAKNFFGINRTDYRIVHH